MRSGGAYKGTGVLMASALVVLVTFAFNPAVGLLVLALLVLAAGAARSTVIVAGLGLAVYPLFPPYIGIELAGVVLFWQRLILFTILGAVAAHFMCRPELRAELAERLRASPHSVRAAVFVVCGLAVWRLLSEMVNGSWRGTVAAANEVLVLLLMAILGLIMWRRASERLVIYYGVVAAATLTAAFALYEYTIDANPLAQFVPVRRDMVSASEQLTRFGRVRATATLGQPLAVGQLLVLGLGLAHAIPAARPGRIVLVALQILMLGGVMATGSRSAAVAVVLGFLAVSVRRARAFATVVILGGIFVLQPFFFREQVANTWQHIMVAVRPTTQAINPMSYEERASRMSALSRVAQVAVSLPVVGESPAFGVGMLNVKGATGLRTIDNYYLLAALESGLPAAVAFTFLVVLAFWASRRLQYSTSAREVDGLSFCVAASAVMLVFVALKVVMPLIYLILGVAIGARASSEQAFNRGT